MIIDHSNMLKPYMEVLILSVVHVQGGDPVQNLTGSNSNPKKLRSPQSGEKIFLGLLGGSGGMLPWKILKI